VRERQPMRKREQVRQIQTETGGEQGEGAEKDRQVYIDYIE